MKKIILLLSIVLSVTTVFSQRPQLNLVVVDTGFLGPLDLKSCGDDRLFIVERSGKIRILHKGGGIEPIPFLDIGPSLNMGDAEQGLLGLAFSPTYKQDGFFYLNYNTGTGAGATQISRFHVNALDSNIADAASEVSVLTFAQSFSEHKGGDMMFGPDGYLYISQGDGGDNNTGPDPLGNGQNKNTFLGKILRIDVRNQSTYAVPTTNPFVGQANVKEEIWAYGFRNPWRASFDKLTGDLWIGDVGQDNYEEVNFQAALADGGQNYGWKCREGLHPYDTTGCASSGFTDPVFEYDHSDSVSCAVIGGFVYRGTQSAKLFGTYVFADYCNGRLYTLKQTSPGIFAADTFPILPVVMCHSMGQDNNGELYTLGENGWVYHIAETSDCKPVAFVSSTDTIEGCLPMMLNALSGDTLSYQWYNSSGPIAGATSFQYSIAQSGWYKIMVSKSGAGCSSISDSVFVNLHSSTPLSPAVGKMLFCNNDAPQSLNGYVIPEGGIYSGPGVDSDTLQPSELNQNATDIYYNFFNEYGCISQQSFLVSVENCTGISEVSLYETINVFPNPNHGVFTIELKENQGIYKLILCDELGRICFEKNNEQGNNISVSIPSLSKGVYVLQLKGANTNAVKRILVD
ncbi:MAG: type sorting protein [Bacteroidota bacterium]|nr:type sorting protein [Bacteroidota bacterium]